jgi:hypothetical protein
MSELSRRGFIGTAALTASLVESTAVANEDVDDASATAQARLTLARAALDSVRAHVGRGQFSPGERDPIWIWSRRRLEARLELSKTKADRGVAAQEHLDEMKAAEQIVIRMHQAGEVDRLVKMEAEYRRLEAQSWLEREKMSKA